MSIVPSRYVTPRPTGWAGTFNRVNGDLCATEQPFRKIEIIKSAAGLQANLSAELLRIVENLTTPLIWVAIKRRRMSPD
jgi:hypothetical protein